MNVRVDNSVMYKYLEEQHKRSAAKTASAQAESRRKEIPYVLAKYGGVALIILSIGLALYFANSFKQISERTNITHAQEQASKSQYMGETDDLIDIDALLNEIRVSFIDALSINFLFIPFIIKLYSPETWYANTGILKLSFTFLIISR